MADRRINVNFSESAYNALVELSKEKGKSMAETLRDAIAIEKFIWDVVSKEGGHILVEHDGKIQELLIR